MRRATRGGNGRICRRSVGWRRRWRITRTLRRCIGWLLRWTRRRQRRRKRTGNFGRNHGRCCRRLFRRRQCAVIQLGKLRPDLDGSCRARWSTNDSVNQTSRIVTSTYIENTTRCGQRINHTRERVIARVMQVRFTFDRKQRIRLIADAPLLRTIVVRFFAQKSFFGYGHGQEFVISDLPVVAYVAIG